MTPSLTAVAVPDPVERWEALGFQVINGIVLMYGVRVQLEAAEFAVAIDGVEQLPDGLARFQPTPIAPVYCAHPNGATGIDHVVVVTPEFDQTATALERVGLPLKRIRDGGGFRQGFRRLGGPILELVESSQATATRWWGLTMIVDYLLKLPADLVTEPKPAVQPGRLIATARSPGVPLAFMTP